MTVERGVASSNVERNLVETLSAENLAKERNKVIPHNLITFYLFILCLSGICGICCGQFIHRRDVVRDSDNLQ